MWFPQWLYERFPLLYVASGIACLKLRNGSAFAWLSAVLLVVAGVLVFVQRRRARAGAGDAAGQVIRRHGMLIGTGPRS